MSAPDAGCAAVHTVASIAEHTGGPARTVTRLCSALGRAGAQVALVTGSSPDDGPVVRPDAERVHLATVDVRRLGPVRLFAGFQRQVEQALAASAGHGLVHDHGLWLGSNLAAWRAARAARVPYVLSPRGMLEPWAMRYNAPRKRVAWLLYQRRIVESAAALVATSAQECESIRRLAPGRPVAIIPNGVDLPSDAPPPAGDRPRTVLFLSRIHPKKNLLGLVEAWHRVVADERAAGWRLHIAGPDEGGHAAQVRSTIERLGLQASVGIDGPVAEADKGAAFARADVFVLPTFSENFGIVVAEALARGVPVVTTTGTPWSELPARGCGWWVAPEPDALAGALREAIALDPAARARMGERGAAYVRERFSWPGVGRSTLALYRWLLGTAPRPDFVHG